MATEVARSINGVRIRLTDERWRHIVQNHDDLAAYYDDVLRALESPEWVLRGHKGALMAVRAFGRGRYLTVAYRETTTTDGFVATAYFARSIDRRRIIWPRRPQ